MGIRSTLRLTGVDPSAVTEILKHLKEIEDIPYQKIETIKNAQDVVKLIIEYPLEVFDKSVAQFFAVLFGELAFMRSFGTLTFLSLDLPEEVYSWFTGPKFGLEQIKVRFRVEEYPMLVGIIKPSLGKALTIKDIENKVKKALNGGLNAVKDDEMQGDLAFAPLDERIALAKENQCYIPTLNFDSIDSYKKVLNENIGMVLINASVIGFPMLHELKKFTNVPLLSHVAMQGTYHGSFSPKVFAQLHRLFGCDAFITPIGGVNYYKVDKQEEIQMVEELTRELPIKKTLPLLTGGARLHNLESIISTYEKTDTPYGVVFGTQIFSSSGDPEEMAKAVVSKVHELKTQT